MTTLIRHNGAIAAVATARRVVLTGPLSDDDRLIVLAKARYAADVELGELEGPYTDEAAELYAEVLIFEGPRAQPGSPEYEAAKANPAVQRLIRRIAKRLSIPMPDDDD